jgi:hypothetical protein
MDAAIATIAPIARFNLQRSVGPSIANETLIAASARVGRPDIGHTLDLRPADVCLTSARLEVEYTLTGTIGNNWLICRTFSLKVHWRH